MGCICSHSNVWSCFTTQQFVGSSEMFNRFQFNKETTVLYFAPLNGYIHSIFDGSHIPSTVHTLIVDNADHLKCFDRIPTTINTIYFDTTSYTDFDVSSYLHVSQYHFSCYSYDASYRINFDSADDFNVHVRGLNRYTTYNNSNVYGGTRISPDSLVIRGKLPYNTFISFRMIRLSHPGNQD